MLKPYALIDVNLCSQLLGLPITGEDRERWEFFCDSASQIAKNYCKRNLAIQEYHKKGVEKALVLESYPVKDLVVIRDGQTLTENNYSLNSELGILEFKTVGEYEVTYSAGYELGVDVPEDLQMALFEIAVNGANKISGNRIGTKSLGIDGGVETSYELEIPLSARKLLNSYKRVLV